MNLKKYSEKYKISLIWNYQIWHKTQVPFQLSTNFIFKYRNILYTKISHYFQIFEKLDTFAQNTILNQNNIFIYSSNYIYNSVQFYEKNLSFWFMIEIKKSNLFNINFFNHNITQKKVAPPSMIIDLNFIKNDKATILNIPTVSSSLHKNDYKLFFQVNSIFGILFFFKYLLHIYLLHYTWR